MTLTEEELHEYAMRVAAAVQSECGEAADDVDMGYGCASAIHGVDLEAVVASVPKPGCDL